ncbi:MAG: hypothetical protein SFU98_14530, partial [Leptospiraceae bacterium]|nr:hypothetical protein [Leptospiraceae bacterium]
MKILFDLKSKLVVPIRIKLFIALIIITLAIIFGFSYTIFQTATQFFLESYLNNKLAIAKIAATTFNGSKHENWGKITSIGNPEFETARDEFKRILSLSDKTRYLYSVNYDKQKDQFFYVL